MPAVRSREEIVRIVQSLPEEASLDDVIERLILLRKVEIGLGQRGQGVPHEEVVAEFTKPRGERRWDRG
jgi:hypothetical protein